MCALKPLGTGSPTLHILLLRQKKKKRERDLLFRTKKVISLMVEQNKVTFT